MRKQLRVSEKELAACQASGSCANQVKVVLPCVLWPGLGISKR